MSAPPRDGRHCDDHPQVELIQRADDAEDTVRRRLEVYREQTAPLLAFYQAQGKRVETPGIGTVDEVYRGLKAAVAQAQPSR
jgi:adenylate kinase